MAADSWALSNLKFCAALSGTEEDCLTDGGRARLPEESVPGKWGVEMFMPGHTVGVALS